MARLDDDRMDGAERPATNPLTDDMVDEGGAGVSKEVKLGVAAALVLLVLLGWVGYGYWVGPSEDAAADEQAVAGDEDGEESKADPTNENPTGDSAVSPMYAGGADAGASGAGGLATVNNIYGAASNAEPGMAAEMPPSPMSRYSGYGNANDATGAAAGYAAGGYGSGYETPGAASTSDGYNYGATTPPAPETGGYGGGYGAPIEPSYSDGSGYATSSTNGSTGGASLIADTTAAGGYGTLSGYGAADSYNPASGYAMPGDTTSATPAAPAAPIGYDPTATNSNTMTIGVTGDSSYAATDAYGSTDRTYAMPEANAIAATPASPYSMPTNSATGADGYGSSTPNYGAADYGTANSYANPATPAPTGYGGGSYAMNDPNAGTPSTYAADSYGAASNGAGGYGDPAAPVTAQPSGMYGSAATTAASDAANYGAEAAASAFTETTTGDRTYTVQPKDSFWSISSKAYQSSAYFEALQAYNSTLHPDPTALKPGDLVRVPSLATLKAQYPDKCPSEQSVAVAAQREAASSVPAPRQPNTRSYTVMNGDNLFRIAKHELGDVSRWVEIWSINRNALGGDPDRLKVGMRLMLPATQAASHASEGVLSSRPSVSPY